MQLNDIIEENTLKEISHKTRLSIENLEKLFAQDFGAFRKVQALGFISILEREYHADLSDLRKTCHAYYDESEHDERGEKRHPEPRLHPAHKSLPVSDIFRARQTSKMVKPIVVGLLVLVLVIAAWQTFSSSMEPANAEANRSGKDVGFFASILNRASGWIGGDANDTTDAMDLESDAGNVEGGSDSFVLGDTGTEGNDAPSAPAAEDDAKDVIAKIRQEQARKLPQEHQPKSDALPNEPLNNAIASAPEVNESGGQPLTTEVPSLATAETNTDTQTADTETPSGGDESVDPAEAARQKAAEELALREREARQKAAEEQALRERQAREEAARLKALEEEKARIREAKEREARAKIVILKPRKKAWIGIVNLTNMKRRVATSKAAHKFDTAKGRWIVATGHGFLTFKEGENTREISDGKKHFLLIENGKVKEISHKQFQKLNKSKVW